MEGDEDPTTPPASCLFSSLPPPLLLPPVTAPPAPAPQPTPPAAEGGADRPLTVLLVHNVYQQPGGEDRVFETEGGLLEAHGHRVLRYTLHNDAVEGLSRAALAARTVWSGEAHAEVLALVRRHAVDVVHVHNTLPLASPSVFWAARRGGAATVHTLHNFRTICPGTLLLRDGAICHDCVGRAFAAPAVRHRCYRGSAAATAAVAATTAIHRAAGTYARQVDRFVALSHAARALFVEGGLPAHKIAVKPNALARDPEPGPGGAGVLFAGRLTDEKGVRVLLDAWAQAPDLPALQIAGDGPLAAEVERAAAADARITWLGWQGGEAMDALMGGAALLVAPSLWYEGWPLVATEAMGQGTPVVATDHGAFSEMVDEGWTGCLFPSGDAAGLVACVRWALSDPDRLAVMRVATWQSFRDRYSRGANYRQLRAVYADALAERWGTAVPPPQPPATGERGGVVAGGAASPSAPR